MNAVARPLLLIGNHTNWWDGFLAYLVARRLGRRFHVLMEAQHLSRYRAFLRVGALPLHRGASKQAADDLERAGEYLDRQAGMWIFPQGERRPPDEPIGTLERGAAQLALAAAEAPLIVPVAFRYRFRSEQLPEAFVLAGTPLPIRSASGGPTSQNRRRLTEEITCGLSATLALLDERVAQEDAGDFELLVEGQLSINKRLDRLRHRMGLLDGPFEPRNG